MFIFVMSVCVVVLCMLFILMLLSYFDVFCVVVFICFSCFFCYVFIDVVFDLSNLVLVLWLCFFVGLVWLLDSYMFMVSEKFWGMILCCFIIFLFSFGDVGSGVLSGSCGGVVVFFWYVIMVWMNFWYVLV